MAREVAEKSALEISRINKTGYHFVGGVSGLVFQVSRTGTKSWLLRTLVGGKRREIGLGGYPDVGIAAAREAARAMKAQIIAGVDPVAERLANRSALAAANAAAITFEQAAEQTMASMSAGWKSQVHAKQWRATLELYAYPLIGDLQVAHVDTSHLMKILEPIWASKTETASRLRSRIEIVLDWAKARKYRTGDNPASWKGNLDHLLPPPRKVMKREHFAALPFGRVNEFLETLKEVSGFGARALEFLILTAARSGEVRGATWSEIDLSEKVWTIPAERMKAGKEHRIPLSSAAIDLLKALPRIEDSNQVFPNSKGAALSDMTLTLIIRRSDAAVRLAEELAGAETLTGWRDQAGKTVTAHGFRSSFRDWAGETTAFPREVIEHALSHQLADKAEAAYARGTLFTKRRRLMDEWGKYTQQTPIKQSAKVTAIGSK